MRQHIKDALLGVATGDALGVPVEFKSRETLTRQPVTGMRSYGTHGQPAGTWSDDSSLTFCLAEMLSEGYNLDKLADRFVNWKNNAYWTPHGVVFDIGIATSGAIHQLQSGIEPVLAGGSDEYSNGNGSLMRILPLLFYIKDMPMTVRFKHTEEVSALTHRHPRSVIACFIYLEMALAILKGQSKEEAYKTICTTLPHFLQHKEVAHFENVLSGKLSQLPEDMISGKGYVVSSLEASIWSILHSDSYAAAVLKAVNLGEDTDTTGAITGGLAGLIYGWESIPQEWLNVLAKRAAIDSLITNLQAKIW